MLVNFIRTKGFCFYFIWKNGGGWVISCRLIMTTVIYIFPCHIFIQLFHNIQCASFVFGFLFFCFISILVAVLFFHAKQSVSVQRIFLSFNFHKWIFA